MDQLKIDDLPEPPEGKMGWPWTEQSEPLSDAQPDGLPRPKVSIVTPSYNQGEYIEETIRSVLLQGYPNLEYVIIDGGSNDETVDIIKKYEPWLDYWVSEADQGQSHAINKGFQHCTGSHGNWLNSDDVLCTNAVSRAVSQEDLKEDTLYVGDCVVIDRQGERKKRHRAKIYRIEELILNHEDYIPQPSCLFPVDRFWEVGGVNVLNDWTMDFELWGKMITVGVRVEHLGFEFAKFRSYRDQKVNNQDEMVNAIVEKGKRLIRAQRGWSDEKQKALRQELEAYAKAARLGGGRLVDWGLPEPLIRALRAMRP